MLLETSDASTMLESQTIFILVSSTDCRIANHGATNQKQE